ncbi:MAG: major capsid protein [Microvirus sp.]|nr:MAG: major capsid protein [Microvirus sp.]
MFSKIKQYSPKRNKFDLTHERKMSMNMGNLVPVLVQEVLPGDSIRCNTELLIRFAPMLAPVMHRINVYTHFFFVPNRLVWSEWENFITGGVSGTDAPVSPYVMAPVSLQTGQMGLGSLADYMGLPVTSAYSSANVQKISAIPFRAYQQIYNDYYRDQNLSQPVPITKNSGEITILNVAEINATFNIRQRAWEKDYFTSALPTAQRGGAVAVPVQNSTTASNVIKNTDGTPVADGALSSLGGILSPTGGGYARIDNNESTLINDLRKANALQRFLEKMNLGGSRYVEQMLTMFGVRSSDQRLQRAEYLGGGRSPVVISEVLSNFQFSGDAEGLPQGNMAGHGISASSDHGFSRSFEEHGYVIGIMSVLPKPSYQQSLPKHFQRFDKFDYAWPDFAHLGEQEVKTKELYWDPSAPQPNVESTFGYQSRYADYKYQASTVHGDMRENLAFWGMQRIFASEPALNESFVTSDPTTRIFAVTDPTLHHLYIQLVNNVSALRALPYYGTPSL